MLNLYPPANHAVYNGATLNFAPEIDQACQAIHDACKGLGTDEEGLVAALGTKSADKRYLMSVRYRELFGRLILDKVQPRFWVPREQLIYPIVMGRTNVEIGILKKTYYDMYGKDLGSVMDSELSGDVKKAVLASLQAPLEQFNPAFHSPQKAEEDAEALHRAGEGRMGTREHEFINILVASPPQHLRAVNAAYEKKHKHGIVHAVKKEFGGDAEDTLLFLVRMVLEPLVLLSELFESTMKGFGTDEKALSAALVRYHLVLRDIRPVYKKTYGKDLRDRIQGEVSGDYGKLVLAVYDSPTNYDEA
ncbi:Annexin (Annexin) Family [Phytophthora infestans T30-4]|uniref:Annexin (Annexin) Family n=1 Tax=Phytophthora infestans (strain T30-4) TaxID=403677 RepID=D0P3M8_PHYIT|nr:Annexin (Annexin) Family [Phytophthora infestans T30-4]EEY60274.1 Annexin (Annexin) Family [Phytophthora infestans T30-4]|eukprot:XP_002895099.1 Annexin (Annexin) Family [Phytophthora infestans T30-4]